MSKTKNKKAKKTKNQIIAKPIAVVKQFSKSDIVKTIAERVGIEKKKAVSALNVLVDMIKAHITKKDIGKFVFPDIAKFIVVHKPATKSRKGKNPFTGEDMVFAAKPARNVVKVKPLKKLKDILKKKK